jgi:hypothetical protein
MGGSLFKQEIRLARITLDLDGPDGNAYFLIGQARILAVKNDLNPKEILEEMMISDYKHLLAVFRKYFSDEVELVGGGDRLQDYIHNIGGYK